MKQLNIAVDCAHVIKQILALSGDIELNPGPNTRSGETQASCDLLLVLKELQSGQASMLQELKSIQQKLSQYDSAIREINKRLTKIESDCESIMGIKEQIDDIRVLSDKNAEDIATIRVRLDDSEDRERRSNLVFGFPDRERETRPEPEASVLQFCSKELNTTIEPMEIERAYRLGKYKLNKSRPIIVRFAHFKTKGKVLSCAYKLKGSNFRISEDVSPNTLQARKHLAEFGRA